MTRKQLPDRRQNRQIPVHWQRGAETVEFTVCVGYMPEKHPLDPLNQIYEVFIDDGWKAGSDMIMAATDACILISIGLLNGETADALYKSMSTVTYKAPDQPAECHPATMIGAILKAIAEEDARAQ